MKSQPKKEIERIVTQRYVGFTESRKREEAEKKGRKKRTCYSAAKRDDY